MPTIMISYRRSDSKWITGRIVDRLERDYGQGDVFVDIDAIPLGMDFRDHLRNVLDRCDVLLAVIGPNWLAPDESGRPRIFEPTDWVRVEIETALAKNIPVIPVLIDRAPMPKLVELPESMHDFAFRQAADVDTGRDFHVHMDRLVRAISRSAAQGQIARPPEPAAAERPLRRTPAPAPETPPQQRQEHQSPIELNVRMPAPRAPAPVDEPIPDTPSGQTESRRRRGIVVAVVAAACVAAAAVMLTHEWSDRPAVIPAPTEKAPRSQDRIPQEPPDTPVPPKSIELPQLERAVLYEEQGKEPMGQRFNGRVSWRAEKMSPGLGQPATLAARAEISIPDRQFGLAFSLRNNTDPNLPASHTIEFMFRLPPNFAQGGISSVPRVIMKQSEQARGVELAGLSVKVTSDFFLIGLSAVDVEQERNIQMLKERAWFDIALVYGDGKRAILAIEKGASGDRVFKEAFAAWRQ